MMPYEKFEAWQVAHRLALEIYRATDRWPKEERFGLSIQLREALFPLDEIAGSAPHGNYDVSPDGKTFVMVRRSPATR